VVDVIPTNLTDWSPKNLLGILLGVLTHPGNGLFRRQLEMGAITLSPIAWHKPDVGVRTSGGAAFRGVAGAVSNLASSSTDFNTGAGVSWGWAGWVRITKVAAGDYVAVGKGGGGGYEWLLAVNYPTAGSISVIGYSLAGAGTVATWGGTLSSETYYFVAVSRDGVGNTLSISVNGGTFVTVASAQPSGAGTSPFGFGGGNLADGNKFVGEVGPNGYWSRTLTSSDVTALYNGGTPVLYSSVPAGQLTGLVAYYDFDSTSHLTADRTGNGHTLTNNNGVLLGQGPTTSAVSDGVPGTQWADQSGNGRTYVPATGTAGPVWTANVQNGLPMLKADGSTTTYENDSIATALSGSGNTYSWFGVLKGITVNSSLQQVFLADDIPIVAGINDPVIEFNYAGDGSNRWSVLDFPDTGPSMTIAAGTGDAAAHVFGIVASASTITFYQDGVSIGSQPRPSGQNTVDTWVLLTHRSGTQLSPTDAVFTGYYGEELILPSAPDAATRTKIFNYFRTRWGTP
jgi:Concanavalin A-like lectin/glucanases superfamily